MQHSAVFSTPERSTAVAPTRVTTTLYDVMAALQTVVEPEEDDLVVATKNPAGCPTACCGEESGAARRAATISVWPTKQAPMPFMT